jgi:hypothetical protein
MDVKPPGMAVRSAIRDAGSRNGRSSPENVAPFGAAGRQLPSIPAPTMIDKCSKQFIAAVF